MTEYRNKIHSLVDNGVIDQDTLITILVGWMSEDEAKAFCSDSDLSAYFAEDEEEEEEEEEEVDGVQFRYIIKTADLNYFKAELYRIESDGSDSMEPVFVVEDTTLNVLLDNDIEPLSCEEVADYYWTTLQGNAYADHYLDGESDPVVMS